MCSPRLSAMAARQKAAAIATAPQSRCPKNFFNSHEAPACVEVVCGISELLQFAQSGKRADAPGKIHVDDGIPPRVHGSDVTSVAAGIAHQDDEKTVIRVPQ